MQALLARAARAVRTERTQLTSSRTAQCGHHGAAAFGQSELNKWWGWAAGDKTLPVKKY